MQSVVKLMQGLLQCMMRQVPPHTHTPVLAIITFISMIINYITLCVGVVSMMIALYLISSGG